jgi:hypothetical protein
MNSGAKTIVWIHADCLSPHHPGLEAVPDAPAIFVWDDALLQEWRISLKRIVFIYECLLDLPVVIRRGDVAEQVVAFAREHGAMRILTAESPSPRFRKICKRIAGSMPTGSRLEVLGLEPLVDYEGYIDLKRFSRYWNMVRKYAFGGK